MFGNSPSREEAAAIKEKIETIPRAMRHMGWTVSAALMDRWLRAPAWRLPEAWKGAAAPDPRTMALQHLDQGIVRMDWAMRHARVRVAMDSLRAAMANDAAQVVLRQRVASLPWGASNALSFGSRRLSAIHLDQTCQSNRETFGGILATMDDLYGGLGKATLKVALVGEAVRDAQTGGTRLHVTDAGFYIRDTYDFNGPQNLGTWMSTGVLNKEKLITKTLTDGLTFRWGKPAGLVGNGDFEAYRWVTGLGGDFVIYSDVHWERVDLKLDLS